MSSGRHVLVRYTAFSAATARYRVPNLNRNWSFVANATERQLCRLQKAASSSPDAQAAYLRALSKVRPEDVVSRVESGDAGRGVEVTKEYLRALSQTRALRADKLPHVLAAINSLPSSAAVVGNLGRAFQRSDHVASQGAAAAGDAARDASRYSAVPAWALASLGRTDGAASTAVPPLQVALTEPSMQSQLWRLVRVLGTTFLLLGFLGVLMVRARGDTPHP
jgi:hypothetical protein